MVSTDVEKMVIEQFGQEQAGDVLAVLERYGSSPNQFEVERVHRVILQLAQGNVSRVSSLVDLAIEDYRDILVADAKVHEGIRLPRPLYMFLIAFVILYLILLLSY